MKSELAEQPQSQGKLEAPGAQLKVRREAMGWSIEQVADQLKLAPRQVIALEAGDVASLPNMAVVRGFVRAYAKVVKLDAAPLVAMIEVNPGASQPASAARREITASFSKARFPSMTQRSFMPKNWIVGVAVAAVVVAALGAYRMGFISPAMLMRADMSHTSAPLAAGGGDKPVDTTLVKPGQEVTPLQSLSVPLISVPPAAGAQPVTPVAGASAAATAAVTGNALVLTAHQDSWVELRRVGAAPLISRTVKAGSTETFNISEPMLLIVGKPTAVEAKLRGAPLDLTPTPGGTTSRVGIK